MCLGTAGVIVEYLDDARQTATVDFVGTLRTVNTAMVAGEAVPPKVGDWVLVHLGIALHQVEPEEAAKTQTFFDDLLEEFEEVAARRDVEIQAQLRARQHPQTDGQDGRRPA